MDYGCENCEIYENMQGTSTAPTLKKIKSESHCSSFKHGIAHAILAVTSVFALAAFGVMAVMYFDVKARCEKQEKDMKGLKTMHTPSPEQNLSTTPDLDLQPSTIQATGWPAEACYMGMKSGLIPDSNITASSQWGSGFAAYQGRLDNQFISECDAGAWASRSLTDEWFQVDFGRQKHLAGVATQGSPKLSIWQFVRSYKVRCGDDLQSMVTIKDGGEDKVFEANTDRSTKVFNRFPEVISCKLIRIYPQTWQDHCTMRVEFISGRCFNDTALWSV